VNGGSVMSESHRDKCQEERGEERERMDAIATACEGDGALKYSGCPSLLFSIFCMRSHLRTPGRMHDDRCLLRRPVPMATQPPAPPTYHGPFAESFRGGH
jgi:hypothetical protein